MTLSTLLKKIFVPSREARIYTIILVIFFVGLSAFIWEDGFVPVPYIIMYLIPPVALLAWAITIMVGKLIGEGLVKIQVKILPNNRKIFISLLVLVLVVILFFPFIRAFSSLVVKVLPFDFVCQRSIDHDGDRDRCYQVLAYKKNDPQICQAGSSFVWEDCYAQLAIKNNDPKICNLLPRQRYDDDYYETACYARVAIDKNDLTFCDQAKDRARCYESFAVAKHDERVCEQMVDFADSEQLRRCRSNVLGVD